MKDKKVVKLRKTNFFKNSIFIPFILLITALIILAFSPLFNITTIKVKGNLRLKENTIVNASNIDLGQNILRLNKEAIKEDIKRLAHVEEVIIRRQWPDTVVITVKEKDALARLSTFAATIAIDEEGNVLETYSDNSVVDLPLIGNIEVFSYGIDKELNTSDNQKINNMLEVLKSLKKNDMLSIVEKIEQDENINVYIKNGHVVNFGDINNLDYKIKRLKAVIEKEVSEKYYIDISNINIYPISKPLWTVTKEKQEIEVVE